MRPCRGAEALGYGMQSPPARAMADYVLKDHKPSLSARKPLRGWRVGYPCHIAGETWVDSARRAYPTSVRAKALPECAEAPAGLACRLSLPFAGETWVDSARRAYPTSVRAKALPECAEAPAGLACLLSLPYCRRDLG